LQSEGLFDIMAQLQKKAAAGGGKNMGQVLIQGLEDDVIERLTRRAEGNHRTLEGELREILLMASRQFSAAESRRLALEMRDRLGGREHSDSAELIREDRDR
jgi:antitoxin FitA